MNDIDIWKQTSWNEQADKLLKNIVKFPHGSKIILLLRHSERDEPTFIGDGKELLLTPLGHKIANIFGQRLPLDKNIRIYHSLAKRCSQTATEIFNGIIKKGGKADLHGTISWRNISIDRDFFIDQMRKLSLYEFIHQWAADLFPNDKITPLTLYSRSVADIIWNLNKSAALDSIDIHISHEIVMMGLRIGWFGLFPEDKWVKYLGGLAFIIQKDNILIYDFDEFRKVEIPSWWKK